MYAMVKTAALLLAILGYAMLWRERKLPVCFFPITFVSGITLAVYVFGLLGKLKWGSYFGVAAGGLLLLRYFSRERLKAFLSDWSTWFCIFAIVWIFVITRGETLYFWDDGSHWYRICKAMNFEGAYPTTPDILYYEYVPGCATWIYFVTRFIGFTIPNCLFAQNCINVVSIAALFISMIKMERVGEKILTLLIIGLTGVALCAMTISTYALAVDAQVGLVAMAAFVMMMEQEEGKDAYLSVCVVLSFLALIKNSALLFVVIIFLWAGTRYRGSIRKWIGCAWPWLAVPLIVYGIYQIRGRIVYGNAEGALQAISVERYMLLFMEKSADNIGRIARTIFERVVLCSTEESGAVWGCFLLLLVLLAGMKSEDEKTDRKQIVQILVGNLCVLAVYCLGLFLMYVFSMREDEAIVMSSFGRYFGTLKIFLVGITVYACLCQAKRLSIGKNYVLGMVFMFALFVPGAYSRKYILGTEHFNVPGEYKTDLWRAMEMYVPENPYYTDESYLVLWDAEDFMAGNRNAGRLEYVAGAWLRSNHIQAVSREELTDMDAEQLASLAEFDYVVLISDMHSEEESLCEGLNLTEYGVGVHEVEK